MSLSNPSYIKGTSGSTIVGHSQDSFSFLFFHKHPISAAAVVRSNGKKVCLLTQWVGSGLFVISKHNGRTTRSCRLVALYLSFESYEPLDSQVIEIVASISPSIMSLPRDDQRILFELAHFHLPLGFDSNSSMRPCEASLMRLVNTLYIICVTFHFVESCLVINALTCSVWW